MKLSKYEAVKALQPLVLYVAAGVDACNVIATAIDIALAAKDAAEGMDYMRYNGLEWPEDTETPMQRTLQWWVHALIKSESYADGYDSLADDAPVDTMSPADWLAGRTDAGLYDKWQAAMKQAAADVRSRFANPERDHKKAEAFYQRRVFKLSGGMPATKSWSDYPAGR